MLIAGIFMIAIAISIRLWVGRRSFYRRNEYGNQAFSSHSKLLFVRTMENVLSFVGYCMTFSGIILIILHFATMGNTR